nr:phosphotransferase [Candidatus Frankia alpina]
MSDVTDIDLADVLRRATAAARRVHPGADVAGLLRLEGGVSSLTYAATMRTGASERPVVLKVAPAGLAPVRNRDVLRQAQVLRCLAGLDGFPVPAVEFADPGAPPQVPALFGMARRPGESYEPGLDVSPTSPSAAVAAQRMLVAARALARLQARSPDTLGLGAEPVCPAAEELGRWQRLFATVDADIGPWPREAARATGGQRARRGGAAGAPRGLPPGEHAVQWGDPRGGHRLGDLVCRRSSVGPCLVAHAHVAGARLP